MVAGSVAGLLLSDNDVHGWPVARASGSAGVGVIASDPWEVLTWNNSPCRFPLSLRWLPHLVASPNRSADCRTFLLPVARFPVFLPLRLTLYRIRAGCSSVTTPFEGRGRGSPHG
jgi:hypothetical protein